MEIIKALRGENKMMAAHLRAREKKSRQTDRTIRSDAKRIQSPTEKVGKLRDACKRLRREKSDLRMRRGAEMRAAEAAPDPDKNRVSEDVRRINEENGELKRKNGELAARDNHNDGAHTPPPKGTLTQKARQSGRGKKKKGRGPGGQPGHRGAFHRYDKPDETRDITMARCGNEACGCRQPAGRRTETAYAGEMTKPQKRTIRCNVRFWCEFVI